MVPGPEAVQRWHGGAHGSLVAKGVAIRYWYCRVKLRVGGLRDLGL